MYEAKQGVLAELVDWWASSQGSGWRKELRLRLRRWTGNDEAVGWMQPDPPTDGAS